MHRKLVVVIALVAVLGLTAVAAYAATTLRNPAHPTALKYAKKTLTAKAGKITLVMANPSVLPHNIAIKKGKRVIAKGRVVPKGGVSRVVVTLKAGIYRFYCSVPGHEAGGMWGTLRVTA